MYAIHEAPLLQTTLRDWREADDPAAAVLPQHRGEYAVRISRSAYDGLVIDVISPEGLASSILVEAVAGVVKLNTYSPDPATPGEPRDDPDARIFITPDGTLVEPDYAIAPLVVRYRGGAPAERAAPFEVAWMGDEETW